MEEKFVKPDLYRDPNCKFSIGSWCPVACYEVHCDECCYHKQGNEEK